MAIDAMSKPHPLIASDRIEGTAVRRPNGEMIGHIERLMIDKMSGNVAYAVLCFGGFLGVGEDYRPLPWASMKYNPAIEAYELLTLMTDEELVSKLGETRQELFNLRFQSATGALENGAAVSYRGVTVAGSSPGWRMELQGTEGRLVATTPVMPQITPIELRGGRGHDELAVLAVPGRLDALPETIVGPARNVAGLYREFARAIEQEGSFNPDFGHAVVVHEVLESLVRSSREGRAVAVGAR